MTTPTSPRSPIRSPRRLRRALVLLLGAATIAAALSAAPVAAPSAHAADSAVTPPPPLSLGALELSVATELSKARMNPVGMADDLKSAVHDGWYRARLADGVSFSTERAFLTQAEMEARSQPQLAGLRWSDTLAQAARDWIPYYGRQTYRDFAQAHGAAMPGKALGERIARARARVDGKLGRSIEAIATQPMYGKSFVYTWWVSSKEWSLGSPFDPTKSYQTAGFGRGHRGIVNDARMDSVGVACAPSPSSAAQGPNAAPIANCSAVLGESVGDAAPEVLGAPPATPVNPAGLTGLTGTVGATTTPSVGPITVNPTAPPSDTTASGDTARPVADDKLATVAPNGSVTADTTTPTTGNSPTSPTTSDGTPRAAFNAACDGFTAYLRQEVGSHQASRQPDPDVCVVQSPDLEGSALQIVPTDGANSFRRGECDDITQGRATNPQDYGTQVLLDQGTVRQAVTSSGSPGRSFPFLLSTVRSNNTDIKTWAISCDSKYAYRAFLWRNAGVNPLLASNAAAEGMRQVAP